MTKTQHAERRSYVLMALLALAVSTLGLWGAWDRQPMGEARTERQQEVERG